MSSHVVIVGGGLAGLASAAALADRGVRVTLLESRPRLGGRASSFTDAATGETIDNCQHVAMGCCTNFREFCRLLKIDHLFRDERELTFIGPDGRSYPWRIANLPAPLHLAKAFAGLGYFTWDEKLAAARGLRALARLKDVRDGESFADWLARRKQPRRVVDWFWDVVLVSALSESLDRIDAHYARKVFVDGFLANREGAVVTIPTVPLDEIYGGPILNWLTRRCVTVRMQTGAQSLEMAEGRIAGVVLRSGERVAADDFVLAVPQDRVTALLPEPVRGDAYFANAARFETAPISSVHLWFDRPITTLPHAVFVGRTSQWVFRRTAIAGESGAEPQPERGYYYQVVVSASRRFLEMETAAAIELVRGELAGIWPVTNEATLLHSRIVTEHKAVFSPLPGIDRIRPVQQSPIANLQLAGDWTSTGWPATMEGAVRSGFVAAENVLGRLGYSAPVLRANLSVSGLARLLYGVDPA
jgi:squalene-associated FAD-dependent desaturase